MLGQTKKECYVAENNDLKFVVCGTLHLTRAPSSLARE